MSLDLDFLFSGLAIIVGAQLPHGFRWYASTWDLWFLDDMLQHFSDRDFFSELDRDRVKVGEVRAAIAKELPTDNWMDVACYCPSLSVDFETKSLVSVFPEPLSFEREVPSNWRGEYDTRFWQGNPGPFFDRFPAAERYWVIDGHDQFSPLLKKGF